MASFTPSARRITRLQLGLLFRAYRERAGLSSKEAAQALDWYQAKMSKLEKGGVTMAAAEVDRLLDTYGVTGDDADKMRSLAREARRRAPLYHVAEWAQTYLDLEQAATEVKVYHCELVPGMLQTEDYARAIVSAWPTNTPEDIEQRAVERSRRLDRFTGPNPPHLWAVLGEAVLCREVGGPQVLLTQLRHLREVATRRNVTLQVLPFSGGEHIALESSFTIFELTEPVVATFVYLETMTDADYLDRPPHTDAYSLAFTKLPAIAASERDSLRMLDKRIKDLE